MTTPSPFQLWQQAAGDQAEYSRLLRLHGHILEPGDPGYDQAAGTGPCGWRPGRPRAEQDPLADTRPPIPLSLADRPVRGGLALPWINSQLADGGADFRSTHRAKFGEAWLQCKCQSCGNPARPYAVLVCGPRQVLTWQFDESPACPPCALYASRACPMVGGRTVTYPDRPRVIEGKRGEKCSEPGCNCDGWTDIDPDHSADMGGQPALPWYAMWIQPGAYQVTGHKAKFRCSDRGCEHERLMINGAQLLLPPLKILLVSEPGNGRIWRKLGDAEACDHAREWLARLGQEVPQ